MVTKHSKRSRRSHRTNAGVFNQFHAHAYMVSVAKKQKEQTLGQKMAGVFEPVKDAVKQAVNK